MFISLVCLRLIWALADHHEEQEERCVESHFYTPEEALLS